MFFLAPQTGPVKRSAIRISTHLTAANRPDFTCNGSRRFRTDRAVRQTRLRLQDRASIPTGPGL